MRYAAPAALLVCYRASRLNRLTGLLLTADGMSSGLDEQDGACVFGALGSHSTDDEDSEYSQEADSSSTCNSVS